MLVDLGVNGTVEVLMVIKRVKNLVTTGHGFRMKISYSACVALEQHADDCEFGLHQLVDI